MEDTEHAKSFYIDSEYPKKLGGRYLYLYGLLQSLFLQQDAVRNIFYALLGRKLDIKKDYLDLYLIRNIRNMTVGHPTNKNAGSSFHYLVQTNLTKNEFTVMSKLRGKKDDFETFIVEDLLSKQQNEICIIIDEIIDSLKKEDNQRMEVLKMKKLPESKINDIKHYSISKLFDSLLEDSGRNKTMANVHLKCIKLTIANLKEYLSYKFYSLDETTELKNTFNTIEELQERLCKFIKDEIKIDKITLESYLINYETKINELLEYYE